MAEQTSRPRRPSAVKAAEERIYQVMVDMWGHLGFRHGDIVRPEDAPDYDFEGAERQGAIRRLTEAEARSWPTTQPLDADGFVDEEGQEARRLSAGGVPAVTVTTPAEGTEPADGAKPTVDAGPTVDQPAANPIQVVDTPEDVAPATAEATETVPTEAGEANAADLHDAEAPQA